MQADFMFTAWKILFWKDASSLCLDPQIQCNRNKLSTGVCMFMPAGVCVWCVCVHALDSWCYNLQVGTRDSQQLQCAIFSLKKSLLGENQNLVRTLETKAMEPRLAACQALGNAKFITGQGGSCISLEKEIQSQKMNGASVVWDSSRR